VQQDAVEWVYLLRMAAYYCSLKLLFKDPQYSAIKESLASKIEKIGTLKKIGGSIQSLKQRYFVLKGEILTYYKNDKSKTAQGTINLIGAKVTRLNRKKGEYGLSIHRFDRQYYLVCESEREQQDWLTTLTQAIEATSEAQMIKRVSVPLHVMLIANLFKNDKEHGGTKQFNYNHLPPHSPQVWLAKSFHRSDKAYMQPVEEILAQVEQQQKFDQQQQQQQPAQ